MPLWIRSVFLHYLPAALLMRRPRKTRLRWMMEMPGMGAPPHAAAPHDLPKHIRYSSNLNELNLQVNLLVFQNSFQSHSQSIKWEFTSLQCYRRKAEQNGSDGTV